MEVIATNIARESTISWNGKEQQTGIYKYAVDTFITLEELAVSGDIIGNPKVHGGLFKACYLFAKEEYEFWKPLYPELKWHWGVFGENLTVSGLDESKLRIGDQYRVGESLIQITQPREPCFKLGIRFNDQGIIKKFIERRRPGTYVQVLENGKVRAGDKLKLERRSEDTLTVQQCFSLRYAKDKDPALLESVLSHNSLPDTFKKSFRKHQ